MDSKTEVTGSFTGPILSRMRQACALSLWEMGAIRVNAQQPFQLASGNYSPIYVNCRRAISDPDFMRLFSATASMILSRRASSFDCVAGGETAGIPYASHLAGMIAKPMVYVRKKSKGYGLGARVEGGSVDGKAVLLVEDLITDGGSKLSFLDAISEAGGKVTDVLVLFDRQQGGGDLLAERGVGLYAVTDRTTAFAVGVSADLIDDPTQISLDDYFRDPVSWHRQRGLSFSQ